MTLKALRNMIRLQDKAEIIESGHLWKDGLGGVAPLARRGRAEDFCVCVWLLKLYAHTTLI